MGCKTILTEAVTFLTFIIAFSGLAVAHCDTLGGPVIAVAREALESKDITPVLKWVRKEDEAEIRVMFDKTLKVRSKGPVNRLNALKTAQPPERKWKSALKKGFERTQKEQAGSGPYFSRAPA